MSCVRWYWPDLIFPYVKSAQVFNDPTEINHYFDGCTYSKPSSPYNDVACATPLTEIPWIYQGPFEGAVNPNSSSAPYRRDRIGIAYGYAERIGSSAYRNPITADNTFGLTNGHLAGVQQPAETLLLAEAANYRVNVPANSSSGSRSGQLIPRHFDGVNVAFVDGHVKWMKWDVVSAHPVFTTVGGIQQPAPGASETSLKLWLPDYVSQ
jgi:prepilin-type processing-associated H-X9-DG protein